jgi:hypothetical protein
VQKQQVDLHFPAIFKYNPRQASLRKPFDAAACNEAWFEACRQLSPVQATRPLQGMPTSSFQGMAHVTLAG